jgi:hypothetical protein
MYFVYVCTMYSILLNKYLEVIFLNQDIHGFPESH